MNNTVSPLLDVVKADVSAPQKGLSSASEEKGFSESFQEATRELNKSSKPENGDDQHKSLAKDENIQKEPQGLKSEDASLSAKEDESKLAGTGLEQQAQPLTNDIAVDSRELEGNQALTQISTQLNIQLADGAEVPVQDVFAWLQQQVEQGDISQLKALLEPELSPAELNGLLQAFADDGNSLPFNLQTIASLDKIKQMLGAQSLATGLPANIDLGSKTLLGTQWQTSSQLADPSVKELKLTPLADALTTSDLQKVSGNTVAIKLTGEQAALQNTDNLLAQSGLLTSLDEEVISQLTQDKAEPAATRIMSDLMNPQLMANTVSPLNKAQLSVTIPFQQAQWGQAVAERVMWMSSQGIQEAEIYLDPPELGPLQVKVSVANEQAHVSFVVQHGSVREALDQSAMRLRELFEGEGINLADVDVSDQSEQSEQESENEQQSTASSEDIATVQSETVLTVSEHGYSLVNTYV